MKISTEHWYNDTEGVKLKYSGGTVPVPLCPPQISHGLTWD